MIYLGIFLFELIGLFFLSKLVSTRLSDLIYKLSKSQKATIYSMAFLFFPGTVIHELSHLIMAGLLFVTAGNVELWPKLEGNHVKLGSVAIADTDIFRRFLIGAAPFLFGTLLLLGLIFFAVQNNLFTNQLYVFLLAYAVFEVGNTMFSSQKDMEGALELLAALIFFGAVFYFLDIKLPILNLKEFFENTTVTQIFRQGSIFLLIPLGIDILILTILKLFSLRKI